MDSRVQNVVFRYRGLDVHENEVTSRSMVYGFGSLDALLEVSQPKRVLLVYFDISDDELPRTRLFIIVLHHLFSFCDNYDILSIGVGILPYNFDSLFGVGSGRKKYSAFPISTSTLLRNIYKI